MSAPAPPPFRPEPPLERLLGDLFTLGLTVGLMLFIVAVPLRWLLRQLRVAPPPAPRRSWLRPWRWFEPAHPRPRIARVLQSARWPVGCGGAAPSERCHGARVYRVWPGEEVVVKGHEQRLVDTGLRVWAPPGYAALITPCFVFEGDCAPTTDAPADVRVGSLYGTGMLTPEYCDSETLKVWVHNTTNYKVVVSPEQTRPVGYLTFVEASEHAFQKCTPAGRPLWRAQLTEQPAKACALLIQHLAEWLFLPVARLLGGAQAHKPIVVAHHSQAVQGFDARPRGAPESEVPEASDASERSEQGEQSDAPAAPGPAAAAPAGSAEPVESVEPDKPPAEKAKAAAQARESSES